MTMLSPVEDEIFTVRHPLCRSTKTNRSGRRTPVYQGVTLNLASCCQLRPALAVRQTSAVPELGTDVGTDTTQAVASSTNAGINSLPEPASRGVTSNHDMSYVAALRKTAVGFGPMDTQPIDASIMRIEARRPPDGSGDGWCLTRP